MKNKAKNSGTEETTEASEPTKSAPESAPKKTRYLIKNLVVGNLNLPELKMDKGEEKEITELNMAIRDYVGRGYISIKKI